MSNEKRKTIPTILSPEVIAVYPQVTRADTKYVKTGEFHTKAAMEADEATAFCEKLDALANDVLEEKKQAAIDSGKPGIAKKMTVHCNWQMEENDGGEETGRVIIGTFKMKQRIEDKDGNLLFTQRPDIFVKGSENALAGDELASARVWGGTRLRIAFQPVPFYSAKDKQAGVTLRLKAVQVVSMGSNERSASSYGFDAGDEDEVTDAPETGDTGGSFSDSDEF